MWGIIVGLIERWWKDRPRNEAIDSIVLLRDAMINCEERYLQLENYRKNLSSSSDSMDEHSLASNWEGSVDNLLNVLKEMEYQLKIFSPEAHSAITEYSVAESLAKQKNRADSTIKDLSGALGVKSSIQVVNPNLGDPFVEAANKLDTFIRQNFKFEEVAAAKKNRSPMLERIGMRIKNQ